MAKLKLALALAAALVALAAPRDALAEPPSAELMKRLATYAAGFDSMRTHASYAVEGKLESLDGDGKTDGVKEMRARVDADGTRTSFVVLKYTEDGEDKTEDAREKARERTAEREKEKKADREKKEIKMPIAASEQPRYTFDVVETDKADPSRVRISFVPKVKEDNTIEGSAWVDQNAGTVVSAGFKLSRTTMWIDYVHVTVEFGAPTSLGPAVSKVALEGKGGVLFFRKKFRGEATLSNYRIAH
jgi:hypothetical protein